MFAFGVLILVLVFRPDRPAGRAGGGLMAAPTAVAGRRRRDAPGRGHGPAAARARLPLVAAPAGGLVGVLGSYLYWTVSPVRVEGVPLTGRLADFGIGGVRTWSLLLALAAAAYGALVLRARSRTATQGEALARLGIGLAVLPGDLVASPWCCSSTRASPGSGRAPG